MDSTASQEFPRGSHHCGLRRAYYVYRAVVLILLSQKAADYLLQESVIG